MAIDRQKKVDYELHSAQHIKKKQRKRGLFPCKSAKKCVDARRERNKVLHIQL